MCRYLLHLGSRRPGSGVELVYEETGESVELHQVHSLLEVFFRLTGEAADYVGSDGHTRHSAGGGGGGVACVRQLAKTKSNVSYVLRVHLFHSHNTLQEYMLVPCVCVRKRLLGDGSSQPHSRKIKFDNKVLDGTPQGLI